MNPVIVNRKKVQNLDAFVKKEDTFVKRTSGEEAASKAPKKSRRTKKQAAIEEEIEGSSEDELGSEEYRPPGSKSKKRIK